MLPFFFLLDLAIFFWIGFFLYFLSFLFLSFLSLVLSWLMRQRDVAGVGSAWWGFIAGPGNLEQLGARSTQVPRRRILDFGFAFFSTVYSLHCFYFSLLSLSTMLYSAYTALYVCLQYPLHLSPLHSFLSSLLFLCSLHCILHLRRCRWYIFCLRY